MSNNTRMKSVNWHITESCNYRCRFCFSKTLDEAVYDMESVIATLVMLKDMGIEKINFVGGEPLLHPLIYDMTSMAKTMGFVVSIVTNGRLLNEKSLKRMTGNVDWIGISIDSASESIEKVLGRGNGGHVENTIKACSLVHEAGIKLKINTTVTRLNYKEDMRPLINQLDPQRWKVFQLLHIVGQNDDCISELSVTDEEFETFMDTNKDLRLSNGTQPVFERNDDMIDSYLMLAPSGNIMTNHGRVNVVKDIKDIDWKKSLFFLDIEKYKKRGGIYNW